MEPTLVAGQKVWVNHWAFIFRSPREKEIVLFKKDKEVFVKRIERIFPEGFWLRGDNSLDSLDSRTFGLVETEDIIGKIFISDSHDFLEH